MDVVYLNCYLRSPGWLFKNNQSKRIKMIPLVTINNNKTICGLAEVFGNTYTSELAAQYKKHNFNLLSPNTKSSGLAIAYCGDQYEIVGNVIFEKYHDRAWPDNLANKGVMNCRLRCKESGQVFNILVTHLQSAYEESYAPNSSKLARYRRIQKSQLLQLQHFILKS